MNVRLSFVLLLLMTAAAGTARAQTPPIRAGNWEMSMTLSMMQGVPPMKQVVCITPDMLKDPSGSVPKGPAGGDCKMTDYKMVGDTATYKMSCTKPTPMNMTSEVKYASPDAYAGTMVFESGGQTSSMSFTAKRLGECPKQ